MTRRGYALIASISATATMIALFINPPPRLIWNVSASVPTGLYAVRRIDAPKLGDLVAVAPPEGLARFLETRGYLPRNIPLLKHVMGLPGQRVCRIGRRVSIDRQAIGDARERDSHGRPLPVWQGCRTLGEDELFLMNPDVPDSLDGRYFGPLPTATILGRATPLWTDPPRPTRAAAG
ncbi:conjugative transfer signal peptidase TraF [Sphingomonas leidyi]|uniref:Conjugative transfer signal peptidase TraF n=1 Tax=Sphingomonas leidyi TaxID=68569 RepID=A0A7X5UXU5_9SPHN|nr:S26 family signal peptidase [Sphingomonas leidyi]NIJ64284.1 conjugative transfer signal peptidase TraF [Sphingomonas leidyi]